MPINGDPVPVVGGPKHRATVAYVGRRFRVPVFSTPMVAHVALRPDELVSYSVAEYEYDPDDGQYILVDDWNGED